MIEIADLPVVNATLNAVSLLLLLAGYWFIRRKRITAHRRCMICAFCVSIAFLACYLTYRFAGAEKRFGGTGLVRPIYFFILFTHVPLAATIPFLASRTLYLAARGRFDKHRRIARVTFPIWIYVSVTGVLVYLFLFQLYPKGADEAVGTIVEPASPTSRATEEIPAYGFDRARLASISTCRLHYAEGARRRQEQPVS